MSEGVGLTDSELQVSAFTHSLTHSQSVSHSNVVIVVVVVRRSSFVCSFVVRCSLFVVRCSLLARSVSVRSFCSMLARVAVVVVFARVIIPVIVIVCVCVSVIKLFWWWGFGQCDSVAGKVGCGARAIDVVGCDRRTWRIYVLGLVSYGRTKSNTSSSRSLENSLGNVEMKGGAASKHSLMESVV